MAINVTKPTKFENKPCSNPIIKENSKIGASIFAPFLTKLDTFLIEKLAEMISFMDIPLIINIDKLQLFKHYDIMF